MSDVTEALGKIDGGLAAIHTRLGTIDAKLAVMDYRNQGADKMHADYETRLRALERFRFSLMGAALFAGTAAGIVSNLITSGVHH